MGGVDMDEYYKDLVIVFDALKQEPEGPMREEQQSNDEEMEMSNIL